MPRSHFFQPVPSARPLPLVQIHENRRYVVLVLSNMRRSQCDRYAAVKCRDRHDHLVLHRLELSSMPVVASCSRDADIMPVNRLEHHDERRNDQDNQPRAVHELCDDENGQDDGRRDRSDQVYR